MEKEYHIHVSLIQEVIEQAYFKFKDDHSGTNANYIPYLANVPSNLFAISVALPNGNVLSVGDADYCFGLESVSKVPTALLIINQYGPDKVEQMIGADATGLPFNSIIALLLENDHPSTPLVNAGAISACSMIKPIGDKQGKWQAIVTQIENLCGSAPRLIDELYASESGTNYNNRAIAWLLKNYNRIYDDPDLSLDLYTKQCSLGISTTQLAIMGATIGNYGFNPVSKKQVFDGQHAEKIISMIASVGFYEHSGDWLYESGIPAKSGVGGGVLGVYPGLFGIAAFAPPLDAAGNSVKAQQAIKYIMQKLNLHIFKSQRAFFCDHC